MVKDDLRRLVADINSEYMRDPDLNWLHVQLKCIDFRLSGNNPHHNALVQENEYRWRRTRPEEMILDYYNPRAQALMQRLLTHSTSSVQIPYQLSTNT